MPSLVICYFRDGSVRDDRSSYGIHVATSLRSWSYGARMENGLSIFIAEKEARLQCLEMALLRDVPVAIYSDCRSVVQWLANFQRKSFLFLNARLINLSRNLLGRENPITVYWIPGHWGIHGNDQADAIAVLQKRCSKTPPPTVSGPSRQNPRALLKTRLARSIMNADRLRSHRPQYPDDPSQLYDQPNRFDQQLMLWMRTGHSPLQSHLHRVNRAPDPFCTRCSNEAEGRRHFLLECPKYETQRQALIDPILTANNNTRGDPNAVDVLLDNDNIKAVATFCRETGRFHRQRS